MMGRCGWEWGGGVKKAGGVDRVSFDRRFDRPIYIVTSPEWLSVVLRTFPGNLRAGVCVLFRFIQPVVIVGS